MFVHTISVCFIGSRSLPNEVEAHQRALAAERTLQPTRKALSIATTHGNILANTVDALRRDLAATGPQSPVFDY